VGQKQAEDRRPYPASSVRERPRALVPAGAAPARARRGGLDFDPGGNPPCTRAGAGWQARSKGWAPTGT
jgi:hypothetical protein